MLKMHPMTKVVLAGVIVSTLVLGVVFYQLWSEQHVFRTALRGTLLFGIMVVLPAMLFYGFDQWKRIREWKRTHDSPSD